MFFYISFDVKHILMTLFNVIHNSGVMLLGYILYHANAISSSKIRRVYKTLKHGI